MAFEFRCQHRVEFAETDMAGIVHFSNFFRYMELAEQEFLRSLGFSVHGCVEGRVVGWPRVRVECVFASPAVFEDQVEAHLLVRQKRRKSITYSFRFYKQGRLDPIAHGSITAVCAAVNPATGRMAAIAIPEAIDRQIEVAPAEVLHSSPEENA